jgi:hypothetical protein
MERSSRVWSRWVSSPRVALRVVLPLVVAGRREGEGVLLHSHSMCREVVARR